MKDYKLRPQEKENYCVPSVLQAIFNKHNIELSQDEIAKELTPKDKGFDVYDDRIKTLLNKFGFSYEYYSHNTTPFNEPDMVLKEIHEKHILIGWNNHVSLITDFNDPIVTYLDPKDGLESIINLNVVREKMQKSNDGFFGLLQKL